MRQSQHNLNAEARIEELEEAIAGLEEAAEDGLRPPKKNALGRLKDVVQDSTSGVVGQAGGAGIVFVITGLLQSLGWV